MYFPNSPSSYTPTGSTSSYSYSPARGPSGMLTLEMTTYKVDARGARREVEPSDAALDVLDSLIDIVRRH